MKRRLFALVAIVAALACAGAAHAARSYTITQSPAPGSQFDMGSSQSITFQIGNTATGGNAGERIYEVRFRINSGTQFSGNHAVGFGLSVGYHF